MPDAAKAEWILSFVMPAENAAATTGDLLELSTPHAARFWISVLRVFAASLASDFAKRPIPVLGLALGGFLAQFLLPLPVLLPVLLAFFGSAGNQPLRIALVLCILTLTQVVIGRTLAVRFPRNAAAVCIAIGILNAIAGACRVNNASLNMALWQLPLVASFLLSHRRSPSRPAVA